MSGVPLLRLGQVGCAGGRRSPRPFGFAEAFEQAVIIRLILHGFLRELC